MEYVQGIDNFNTRMLMQRFPLRMQVELDLSKANTDALTAWYGKEWKTNRNWSRVPCLHDHENATKKKKR